MSSKSPEPAPAVPDGVAVNKARKATADDFIFGKIIGEGSFSTVSAQNILLECSVWSYNIVWCLYLDMVRPRID